MTQNPPVEEVLHDLLCELVRLLVRLEDCPDAVYTGRLECLSRQLMGYSVALSSDCMDVVAGVENLAVSCADLQEKIRMNTDCACRPWCGTVEENCW